MLSSSPNELLILDGDSTIRRYRVSAGSANLTFLGTIALSQALPPAATCANDSCYGGSFAWDGAYYYFSNHQTSPINTGYRVYDATGAYVADYTVAGPANVNSVYFDWSVARYAIHDGYGSREGGTIYDDVDGDTSDSQCYGPTSPCHTLP